MCNVHCTFRKVGNVVEFSRFCQLLSHIASDCPSVPWGNSNIVNSVDLINIVNIFNIGSQEISRDIKISQGILNIPSVKICKQCQECKSSASIRTHFWACYLKFDYQNLYQQLGNSPKRNAQKMHNIQILLPSFAFRYFLGCSGVDFLIFFIPATAL